jgi:hypothetical protein
MKTIDAMLWSKEATEALEVLGMLSDRWACEKEFEDFAEYKVEMTKRLAFLNPEAVEMKKRPFCVVCRFVVDKVKVEATFFIKGNRAGISYRVLGT